MSGGNATPGNRCPLTVRRMDRSPARDGVLLGVAAYAIWGLFPLFWPLLEPAGAVEILAHRVVWSLVFVLGVLAIRRRPGWLRALRRQPGALPALAVAAVLIAVNWGVYIYAVNSGQVVEASLGYYFINPLVSVLLGVAVLREALRPLQWSAVSVAIVAVVVLVVGHAQLPWIAFTLAVTFATYGLLKKTVGAGAVESLVVETTVLFPPALAYLVWQHGVGRGSFAVAGTGHALLLVSAGVVTAVPLLLFAGAAIRIPLTLLGLLQYLNPVVQFLIGVVLRHEAMPTVRWVGFALVWLALALLTLDGLGRRRRLESLAEPA